MMMKKALGLSLALLLAMAAVGPGMAEEASFVGIWELTGIIDASGTERETTDDTVVQNMSDYMQGKMDFGSIRETDTQQGCHYFFDNADAGWIEQYVADLCAGGCFEIVDRYYEEGEENVWVEYALSYVGSGEVSGEKLEMTYKEGSYGDIVVDYATGGEEGLGFIRIVKGLTFGDLGLRAEAE